MASGDIVGAEDQPISLIALGLIRDTARRREKWRVLVINTTVWVFCARKVESTTVMVEQPSLIV